MIFNEVYSAYYNAVAKVVSAILDGTTDEKAIKKIIADATFGESVLSIYPALKNGDWQIVKPDMSTPLKHTPSMPLTLIQKMWLKAMLEDKRVKLFNLDIEGLEDVEPLFTDKDYYVYDKYADGDPYEDERYINNFQTILYAIKNKKALTVCFKNRMGKSFKTVLFPRKLEYSEKDDKFRLISTGCRYGSIINLARITSCTQLDATKPFTEYTPKTATQAFTLKISDERNTLERCVLHFAHFEKQVERINDKQYLIHVKYSKNDETELLIRVLSFGPTVEVVAPTEFRKLIIERLKFQKSCGLK